MPSRTKAKAPVATRIQWVTTLTYADGPLWVGPRRDHSAWQGDCKSPRRFLKLWSSLVMKLPARFRPVANAQTQHFEVKTDAELAALASEIFAAVRAVDAKAKVSEGPADLFTQAPAQLVHSLEDRCVVSAKRADACLTLGNDTAYERASEALGSYQGASAMLYAQDGGAQIALGNAHGVVEIGHTTDCNEIVALCCFTPKAKREVAAARAGADARSSASEVDVGDLVIADGDGLVLAAACASGDDVRAGKRAGEVTPLAHKSKTIGAIVPAPAGSYRVSAHYAYPSGWLRLTRA